MSREPSNNDKSLSTVGAQPARDGAENLGGVFRLDALSSGTEVGASDAFAGGGSRLSTQSLLLAVLLAGGIGLVYGMRVLGVGPLKNVAEASVPEYDLARSGENKTADHKKAIEELNANHVSTQVPADQVQKNPFRMAEALSKSALPIGGGEDPNARLLERLKHDTEARKKHITEVAASLKVNSILGGPKPVARIGGEFVRIGDTFSDFFTVTGIHGRSVDLEADGQAFTLTMDEDLNQIHKGGKKK